MPRCKSCRLWQQQRNPKEGICGYNPPPAIRAVYDMLHAEPATHINWRIRLSEPFITSSGDGCSEHVPQ